MQLNKRRLLWVLVFVLLFLGGIAGGFFYFSKTIGHRQTAETAPQSEKTSDDSFFVRIFYPFEGNLVMEERKVKRQVNTLAVSGTVLEEFLKGPSKGKSDIPQGTRVLGIYSGSDRVLYVDLSDEFRRNFQGDASTEFLLLKGLYESIISNVQGIDDVKVIIEGKETESIGGHLYTLYPLKNMLQEIR
jgi:spore germination protein GerM